MMDPQFFIVGAPKSATTSLYYYLKAHPGIFMPDRHEMNFFGSDLDLPNRLPDLATYRSFFARARPDQLVGEKSVTYLYSQRAATEIYDFCPQARIIILLRNPADMLFSLHRQFLFSANENIVDFEAALGAEADRRAGARIPKGAHNPDLLAYTAVATYTPQVRRYFERFGKQAVRVLLFEDIRDRPLTSYIETLTFLGVDSGYVPSFEVYNRTKRIPNVSVRTFMKTHRRVSRLIHRLVPASIVDRGRHLVSVTQQQPTTVLDPVLRKTLLTRFQRDIDDLSDLLARDLSHWLELDSA